MKTTPILLTFLACLAAGPADSFAACPKPRLELYFPLAEGTRYYTGPLGSCGITTSSSSACGESVWLVAENCSSSDSYYQVVGDELHLVGGNGFGFDLCFNPPLVELDETIVANGGSRSSQTSGSFYYSGYTFSYAAQANVSVSRPGAITVPAGTFQDCRGVKITIKMTVSLYGQSDSQSTTIEYYLAPGAGQIKLGVCDSSGKNRGWQELTGGNVGGIDVTWFAGAQAPTLPSQPAAQTVPVHGTAVFSAPANGSAPLSYRWQKDGANLSDGGGISGARSSTLVISDVQMSDEATYTVKLTNPLDCLVSTGAMLDVVADTVLPVVSITSPANDANIGKEQKVFRGTAADNARVDRVEYRLNLNDWQLASGTTNWQTTELLDPGTNRFRVRAIDASGNISRIAEVKLFRVVQSPIHLLTQGEGTISGVADGAFLDVNRNYTVTAAPGPGYLFVNWSSGQCPGPLVVLTNSPELTFTMRPGLCVQANFAVNPFFALRGTYNGLYYAAGGAEAESSGGFRITVTKRGAYSGEVLHDLDHEPVSGQFALDGKATNLILCSCMDATFVWKLDLDHSRSNLLTGRVRDNSGEWEADLVGDLAPIYGTNASPYNGQYTIAIPGTHNPDNTSQPSGDGYGTAVVDAAGMLTFSGWLADGKTAVQSVQVSTNGVWPLYVPLYAGGEGMIISWVQLTTNPPVASPVLGDPLLWVRPPNTNAASYANGFARVTTLTGSKYKPAKPVLPFTNGRVELRGRNLLTVIPVRLTSNSMVIAPDGFTMSITKSNGLFSGSIGAPLTAGSNTVKFGGAIIQGQTNGAGYSRYAGQDGQVEFKPSPAP